jgi:outer membrane lipoprotein-sorting protein
MKILITSLFFLSFNTFAQTAQEIIKKSDDARMPTGDLIFDVWVRDFKKRQLEKETRYKVWSKGTLMSLVDTVEPERQKGRKLLMINDDLWFITPDVKRPTRVSFQQRLTGEVSNGDLSRTNFSGDYNSTILSEEKFKGKDDVWVLKLEAARKGVTYSSIKYWVAKKGFLPLKAEFFAASGKLLKTAIYSKPLNILGAERMTSVLIQDAIQATNESIIHYSNHKREKIDESFFNKDSLAQ